MRRIGKDSIAMIVSNSLRNQSHDASYRFTQNKNFYYLTGFNEPNSILVLAPGGIEMKGKDSGKKYRVNEILFVQKKNKLSEKWDGKRLGAQNVKSELGIEYAFNNTDFDKIINDGIIFHFENFFINIIELYEVSGELKDIITPFTNHVMRFFSSNIQICDVNKILGLMRKQKTGFEIRQMKKAVNITAGGFGRAAKYIKPGLYEYQVQSVLEQSYKYSGAEDTAFATIVASGSNACTLHYISNRERLIDGNLVLIDSGAEYGYYCGDITRTYPVNGKFSEAQRVIYEIVLKANKEAIKKIKPGVNFSDLNKFYKKLMGKELVKAGIIKDEKEVLNYTFHGLGHDLGLDTHDAVPFANGKEVNYAVLEEGNILTIEPGLYFAKNDTSVPSQYRGIGVRIEDDVLVTKKGCEVLSKKALKEVKDIEKIMADSL